MTPFASESDGRAIADSVYRAIYAWDQEDKQFFGIGHADFKAMIHGTRIMWAPDGDEAFDDGAYVLQFDVGDRVRLIAFKSGEDYHPVPESLVDIWMNADEFCQILKDWHDGFIQEWHNRPKTAL